MSKNSVYKVHYRAQKRAIEHLKEMGYNVVRVLEASCAFDLMGYDDKGIILVSLKVCSFGKLLDFGPAKKRLSELEVPKNTRRELWIYEQRRGYHYYDLTGYNEGDTV